MARSVLTPTDIGIARPGWHRPRRPQLPTAPVGLAGSFLGGLVAPYAIGLHYRYSLLTGFILAVIFAAIIVAAIDRRPSERR
jgi:hypothetical protein